MKTYLTDTETCGLHGVPVLLQWAIDDGPVELMHLWTTPVGEIMDLIEDIVANRVVAHNLRFDWFHLSKLYNMILWLVNQGMGPLDPLKMQLRWYDLEILADAEWNSQFGPCLKPRAAVDTLLLAAKSENQSFLMNSKAIRVRRVHVSVADELCLELNMRTHLPWILFAGKKDGDARWQVVDNEDFKTGEKDPLWRDIKMSFRPSKGLKDLAVYLCDHETPAQFEDIMCDARPIEEGYAPFVNLLSNQDRDWLYDGEPTWPAVLDQQIAHWANNAEAQDYAVDDIAMLRKLYNFFGAPLEDGDSMTACQVASVRLRGFAVDIPGMREQHSVSTKIVTTAELNVDSPKQVLHYVSEALDEMEQLIVSKGCDQKVIDSIRQEFTLDEREDCFCDGGKVVRLGEETESDCIRCGGRGEVGPTGSCESCDGSGDSEELDEIGKPKKCEGCDGTGLSRDRKPPVVLRVEHIELIRKHRKRLQLYDKIILAGRAYPDFNVIGAKSGRMSGASGLNFHGIDSSKAVRSLFTFADEGLILSAGDYASQELAIAATTMQDEALMADMESGMSLHGIFGAETYETSYEEIMAAKEIDKRYDKSKGGVYAILYGGTFKTVAENMGIDIKIAEAAYNRLCAKYPKMGATRAAVTERFSSMKQDPEGKIRFFEPAEMFVESVFGFRRYFTTEYAIQKMILEVINNMPQHLKTAGRIDHSVTKARSVVSVGYAKVERTEGKFQTLSGAICSAMYGAGFSIQNQIIRASNNHVIQSTGRHLTMGTQSAVWELQPQGIHEFVLTLMSIHDELAVVSKEEVVPRIQEAIERKVEEQRETVPLTSIEWYTGNKSWSEKSHGEDGIVIGWSPEVVV